MSKRINSPLKEAEEEQPCYFSNLLPELINEIAQRLMPLELLQFSRTTKSNAKTAKLLMYRPISIAILTRFNRFLVTDPSIIRYFFHIEEDGEISRYRILVHSISSTTTKCSKPSLLDFNVPGLTYPVECQYNGMMDAGLAIEYRPNYVVMDIETGEFFFKVPFIGGFTHASYFIKGVVYWTKDYNQEKLESLLLDESFLEGE